MTPNPDHEEQTPGEMLTEAARIASRYAPPAAYDPVHAGMVGSVAAGAILAVFTGTARLDLDHLAIPMLVTLGVAFLVPWAILRHTNQEHHKATMREYESMKRRRAR